MSAWYKKKPLTPEELLKKQEYRKKHPLKAKGPDQAQSYSRSGYYFKGRRVN